MENMNAMASMIFDFFNPAKPLENKTDIPIEITDGEMKKKGLYILVSYEDKEYTIEPENHLFFDLRTETESIHTEVLLESEISIAKIYEILCSFIPNIRNFKKNIHFKTLSIDKKDAEKIKYLLSHEPESEEECFGEYKTIAYTVSFDNDMEMDIKLCGVQYREGESNLPWTEAVLFSKGSEVVCSEPSDGFFGEWTLSTGTEEYTVNVEEVL